MALTYTASRYAVPILANASVRLGGVDLRSFGFELTQLPNLVLPGVNERLVSLDNRSGSIDMGSVYGNWSFSLEGQIQGLTLEDLQNKFVKLKRFLDVQQHAQSEFLVNQESVRGISFELVGFTYWYTDGTVDVTNNSKNVTGNSTTFTKYLSPGSAFEVDDGTSTRYYVAQVESDTSIWLTAVYGGANGSTKSYRAERRMHLVVNYDGNSTMSAIGQKGFLSQSGITASYTTKGSNVMNLSLGFRTVDPYWKGDWFEDERTTVASDTFIELEGIGTAPFLPQIQITGASDQATITVADYAFAARFEGNLDAKNTQNSTVTGSYTGGTEKYVDTVMGLGAHVNGSDTLFFDTVLGNANQMSFLARVKPKVAATSVSGQDFIFDWYTGARTDAFSLVVNGTDDKYELIVRSGSSDTTFSADDNSAKFAANQEVVIMGWYHSSGVVDDKDGTTYYAKILVGGEVIGTRTSSMTAPANQPDDLIVGGQYLSAGPVTAQNQLNLIMDELVLFNIALTDEDLIQMYTQHSYQQNRNTSIAHSENLAVSDIVTLSPEQEYSKYDNSELIVVNNGTSVTGPHPVLRGNVYEKAIVHVSTNSGTVNALKFTYRPHLR